MTGTLIAHRNGCHFTAVRAHLLAVMDFTSELIGTGVSPYMTAISGSSLSLSPIYLWDLKHSKPIGQFDSPVGPATASSFRYHLRGTGVQRNGRRYDGRKTCAVHLSPQN